MVRGHKMEPKNQGGYEDDTRACGQSSQEPEIGPSRPAGLAPSQATNLEPSRPPRLAPSQAENIVHFSKIKIAEEKNVVEIKTVDSMNAKNANIDVSKNVMNDRECQGISENGQSEVESVSCEVMKSAEQNAKNGPSRLKELNTESLDTSIRKKQPFKIFNITKTSSSKKIRVNSSGIFCLQYLHQQNTN